LIELHVYMYNAVRYTRTDCRKQRLRATRYVTGRCVILGGINWMMRNPMTKCWGDGARSWPLLGMQKLYELQGYKATIAWMRCPTLLAGTI